MIFSFSKENLKIFICSQIIKLKSKERIDQSVSNFPLNNNKVNTNYKYTIFNKKIKYPKIRDNEDDCWWWNLKNLFPCRKVEEIFFWRSDVC